MEPCSRTAFTPFCPKQCCTKSSIDVNCEKTSALAEGSAATMRCSSSRRASILVELWKRARSMRERMEEARAGRRAGAAGAAAAAGAGASAGGARLTVSGAAQVGQAQAPVEGRGEGGEKSQTQYTCRENIGGL
jgi:hypothetical protein